MHIHSFLCLWTSYGFHCKIDTVTHVVGASWSVYDSLFQNSQTISHSWPHMCRCVYLAVRSRQGNGQFHMTSLSRSEDSALERYCSFSGLGSESQAGSGLHARPPTFLDQCVCERNILIFHGGQSLSIDSIGRVFIPIHAVQSSRLRSVVNKSYRSGNGRV